MPTGRITLIAGVVFVVAVVGCLWSQPGGRPAEDLPLPDLKSVSSAALDGHGQEVGSVGFSRDGKLVATGCYDRKVRVFVVATGKELHSFDFGDDVDNTSDKLGVRTQGLQEGVVFDRDGKRLAAVGGSWLNPPTALATVFDLTAKKAVFTSRAHNNGMVRGAAFTGDGELLITAGHDSTLKVLDATTGKEQGTFKRHDWVVTAVTISPDGKMVASVCCNSKKRSIRIWDPVTLKESQNVPLPDRIFSLNDLAFSPDGKHIAGVSNWRLHMWEVTTGKPAADAIVEGGLFKRIAYSPDGKRIAVAGGQGGGDGKGILRVYDVSGNKVYLAFVDAEVGKELLGVAWPTADAILTVGVRGTVAKVVRVQLQQ
jgi:WD40 repeat protein